MSSPAIDRLIEAGFVDSYRMVHRRVRGQPDDGYAAHLCYAGGDAEGNEATPDAADEAALDDLRRQIGAAATSARVQAARAEADLLVIASIIHDLETLPVPPRVAP